jgi:hypothetical protein
MPQRLLRGHGHHSAAPDEYVADRRLALKQGESADAKVAYVTILGCDSARQGALHAFGNKRCQRQVQVQLGSGFTATLQVDAEGLVEDYPELFRRVKDSADGGRLTSARNPPAITQPLKLEGGGGREMARVGHTTFTYFAENRTL